MNLHPGKHHSSVATFMHLSNRARGCLLPPVTYSGGSLILPFVTLLNNLIEERLLAGSSLTYVSNISRLNILFNKYNVGSTSIRHIPFRNVDMWYIFYVHELSLFDFEKFNPRAYFAHENSQCCARHRSKSERSKT